MGSSLNQYSLVRMSSSNWLRMEAAVPIATSSLACGLEETGVSDSSSLAQVQTAPDIAMETISRLILGSFTDIFLVQSRQSLGPGGD